MHKAPGEAATVIATIPDDRLTHEARSVSADLAIEAGRMAEAEKILRALTEDDPSPANRYRLASVLGWMKRYGESLDLFAVLVKENPRDIQLRRRYAQVLGWAGRSAEAAEQWKLSLDEDS